MQIGPGVVVLCTDEAVRDVIAYWLGAASVDLFVAADGYEANQLLKGIASGVLVTDRVLPPWPGLDTFRQIRAANPRLAVAVVGDGSLDATILARIAGASIMLRQPLTRRQVVDALARPSPGT